MPYDLIDRRVMPRREPQDSDPHRDGVRSSLWRVLGFGPESGSPDLTDHQAAAILIEAAVERLAGSLGVATSTRTRRWHTAAGPSIRTTTAPTRSRRYGVTEEPERQIRAYLLGEVLGLSYAEIASQLGITRMTARHAKTAGAELVRKVARTKLDPRRPSLSGRPCGRNERPW